MMSDAEHRRWDQEVKNTRAKEEAMDFLKSLGVKWCWFPLEGKYQAHYGPNKSYESIGEMKTTLIELADEVKRELNV